MESMTGNEKRKNGESGFTLTELAIATAVLMFGVVAVMRLVPLATNTDTVNRNYTTAMVIAQHYLDELTTQPLKNPTVTDPVCGVMSLGTGALGNPVMSPTANYLTNFNGTAAVDFTQAAVAGYSCDYSDPNDVYSGNFHVRWGVVVSENGAGQVQWKRFVVGVKRDSPQFGFPVNVGAAVQR